MLWRMGFLTSAALLAGCSAMYGKVGGDYSKAHDEATQAVAALAKDGQHVARIEEWEAFYLSGIRHRSDIEGFKELVCTGSDSLASQKAALKVLAAYSKSIADVSKARDQNVAEAHAAFRLQGQRCIDC